MSIGAERTRKVTLHHIVYMIAYTCTCTCTTTCCYNSAHSVHARDNISLKLLAEDKLHSYTFGKLKWHKFKSNILVVSRLQMSFALRGSGCVMNQFRMTSYRAVRLLFCGVAFQLWASSDSRVFVCVFWRFFNPARKEFWQCRVGVDVGERGCGTTLKEFWQCRVVVVEEERVLWYCS